MTDHETIPSEPDDNTPTPPIISAMNIIEEQFELFRRQAHPAAIRALADQTHAIAREDMLDMRCTAAGLVAASLADFVEHPDPERDGLLTVRVKLLSTLCRIDFPSYGNPDVD